MILAAQRPAVASSAYLGICNLEKFDWRSGFFNESHQDPRSRLVRLDNDLLSSYRFVKIIDLKGDMRHSLHEFW
jgi:hypothetical protein